MVARDRLDTSTAELKSILARLRRLEAGANTGYTSISEGALRVASEEGLIVEGSASVTGILVVSGVLNADGTVTLTGPVQITGPFTVEGDTTVSGKFDVTGPTVLTGTVKVDGPTEISGATSLKGNLAVSESGKITIGALQMGPNFGGGSGGITSSGDLFLTTSGTSKVRMISAEVVDNFEVGQIKVTDGVTVPGLLTTPNKANVYVDSSGHLFRSTAP